jgi:hypothetical protein
MPPTPILTKSRWGLPLIALAAGWLGSQLPAIAFSGEARAATPVALAPLSRLVIEADIRRQIALYGMYVDGDGAGGRKRDLRTLADTLMTPDVVSEIHPANGSTPLILNGRDVVASSPPEVDAERAKRIAGRHYLLTTVFDALTPSTAVTRTNAVYFDATKNLVGPKCKAVAEGDCGGTPVKTIMWVYEMTWRKTPQGWQIAKNILRDDN